MQPDLKLFPVTKHIPQWLADYFYKANAGSYPGKQAFYTTLKLMILGLYGEPAGYDLQIINKPCFSCGGMGVYKYYYYEDGKRYVYKQDKCYNCKDGIYEIKKIYLHRYVLNGSVYHIPVQISGPVINIIKGYIVHEPVNAHEAYKAYIILLWKYNKSEFYRAVNDIIKAYSGNLKKEIQKFISLLIMKDNTKDELPF